MTSFLKRFGLEIGVAAAPAVRATEESSSMQNHHKIDVISHDPKTDRVVLSMIETRAWGEAGALLPDFQEKLNTYMGYVLGGQLAQDYPSMKDKKVTFLLQTKFPLTQREEHFVEIVKKKYLDPRDILWAVQPLGTSEKKANQSPDPTAPSRRGSA
jgi:hypothetical protein